MTNPLIRAGQDICGHFRIQTACPFNGGIYLVCIDCGAHQRLQSKIIPKPSFQM